MQCLRDLFEFIYLDFINQTAKYYYLIKYQMNALVSNMFESKKNLYTNKIYIEIFILQEDNNFIR